MCVCVCVCVYETNIDKVFMRKLIHMLPCGDLEHLC